MEILTLTKPILYEYVDSLIEMDCKTVLEMGNTYSTEMWGYDNFCKDISGKWKFSKIAVADQSVLGCVIATKTSEGSLHVNRFFVGSGSRGGGVGGLLLREVVKVARIADVHTIDLYVGIDNDRAIKFYEQNGFYRICRDSLKNWLEKTGRTGYCIDYITDEKSGAKMYLYEKDLRGENSEDIGSWSTLG